MADPDLVVVGCGPAGMAAACLTAKGGMRVLILDEQPHAGGQIYRNVAANSGGRDWLGKDYSAGSDLVEALDHPLIRTQFDASVWRVEPERAVYWSHAGESHLTRTPFVLLSGGAQDGKAIDVHPSGIMS